MGTFNEKMFLPNTYCYLKDSICRLDHCMSNGKCEVCQFGLLRSYAARDSDFIGELMKEIETLTEANKKFQKKIKEKERLNRKLVEELSFLKTENSTLTKGLAECCDRLWYYFGEVGDKWSDNRCKNVYETAQFYLGRAKQGEDDAGKY